MSRSRPERRLAQLERASLARLLRELRASESLAGNTRNSRSTALFRSIAGLLNAMPANVRPSFTEFYNSLPIRYRTLVGQAQRRQAGLPADYEPPVVRPSPNSSWDDGELDDWTGMNEVTNV